MRQKGDETQIKEDEMRIWRMGRFQGEIINQTVKPLILSGAGGGNRTRMGQSPLDFESDLQ